MQIAEVPKDGGTGQSCASCRVGVAGGQWRRAHSSLANAKAQQTPPPAEEGRAGLEHAVETILSCAAAKAVATSLFGLKSAHGEDGDTLSVGRWRRTTTAPGWLHERASCVRRHRSCQVHPLQSTISTLIFGVHLSHERLPNNFAVKNKNKKKGPPRKPRNGSRKGARRGQMVPNPNEQHITAVNSPEPRITPPSKHRRNTGFSFPVVQGRTGHS